MRLEALRKKKGVTQAEVGEAVGVTAMAISFYEKGERIPRDGTKIKLAEYFSEPVSFIFFDDEVNKVIT